MKSTCVETRLLRRVRGRIMQTEGMLSTILCFFVGLIAGFVDAIAGGGGLITLPALLSMGMPPVQALATNKLQATFGSCTAAVHFVRVGEVSVRKNWPIFLITFAGSLVGTLTVRRISSHALDQIIPWLLIGLALFMIFKPSTGEMDRPHLINKSLFAVLAGVGMGFYDGFFGPGTGTFWVMLFVAFLGMNLRTATAHTKFVNFASNLASLLVFLPSGAMAWGPGIAMGAGQMVGARLGAGMVMKRGLGLIRPIFIVVCLALTAKLLYESYR